MITLQSMYNKVAKHLLKQNAVSRREYLRAKGVCTYQCAYRGENGLKCAIGCLIPDSLYDPKMEGKSLSNLCSRWPLHDYIIPGMLAIRLQNLHDNNHPKYWGMGLVDIARDFNLKEIES